MIGNQVGFGQSQQNQTKLNPLVSNFFAKYQQHNSKNFKGIIDSQIAMPSSQRFKKRNQFNERKDKEYEQIRKLQRENDQFKQLYQRNKNSITVERQLETKIQALERSKLLLKQQNQLLSEKKSSINNNQRQESQFDRDVFKAYAPYISYPLSNHLQQITLKKGNSVDIPRNRSDKNADSRASKIQQLMQLQQYTENKLGQSQSNIASGLKRISSMKMINSQYSNNNHPQSKKSEKMYESNNNQYSQYKIKKSNVQSLKDDMKIYSTAKLPVGILDPNTCSRNKIAFFKQSIVLVQDALIQVVIQKKQLQVDFRTQKCIILIKNSSPNQIKVKLSYSNTQRDYRINKNTQISQTIQPNQTSSESLEILLLDQYEINSVVDTTLNVEWYNTYINQFVMSKYQFWLPLTFINFPLYPSRIMSPPRKKIQRIKVKPDEQFRTYEHTLQAGVPLQSRIQNGLERQVTTSIYGQSVFLNGSIKLTWKSNENLIIEGAPQWLSLFAFIFSKIKINSHKVNQTQN